MVCFLRETNVKSFITNFDNEKRNMVRSAHCLRHIPDMGLATKTLL